MVALNPNVNTVTVLCLNCCTWEGSLVRKYKFQYITYSEIFPYQTRRGGLENSLFKYGNRNQLFLTVSIKYPTEAFKIRPSDIALRLKLLVVLGVVGLLARRLLREASRRGLADAEGVSVHRYDDGEDRVHDEVEQAERSHRLVSLGRVDTGVGGDLAVGEEDAHQHEEELREHRRGAHQEAGGELGGMASEDLPAAHHHEEDLDEHAPGRGQLGRRCRRVLPDGREGGALVAAHGLAVLDGHREADDDVEEAENEVAEFDWGRVPSPEHEDHVPHVADRKGALLLVGVESGLHPRRRQSGETRRGGLSTWSVGEGGQVSRGN